MNPEEIIARESARLGRPLTANEKAAIRAGASSTTGRPEDRPADGIVATPLGESSAERTAREARASAVERDRNMAELTAAEGGIGDWVADTASALPTHLRDAAGTISEWAGPSAGLGAALLSEAADADDEEIRSRARSIGYGAVEGATLGFGDELAGGVAALGGGDYAATRDRVREESSDAYAENPTLYGGSALLTGAAVPIPGLGGAAGGVTRAGEAIVPRLAAATSRAMRAGAAGGAIGGAGVSESNLADDPSGLLADIGMGAGMGAGTGLALGGGTEVAREVVRAAPAVREAADRAVMAVPSRSSRGGERLLAEMGGELPTAAPRVREIVRSAGMAPSSGSVLAASERALEGASSAPYEARLDGMHIDPAELEAIYRNRVSGIDRSITDRAAGAAAPIRAVADEFAAMRPRPAPTPPASASRGPTPPRGPSGPPARSAGRMGPPAEVLPAVPVRDRPITRRGLTPPADGPVPEIPGSETVPDIRSEPTGAYYAGGSDALIPELSEGTIPPGLGLDADELEALHNRLRAARAAGSAPVEPGTGVGGPRGRARLAAAAPEATAPPPVAPRDSSPAALRPTAPPAGGTAGGIGLSPPARGGTSLAPVPPAAGPGAPSPGPYRAPAGGVATRPRGARPPGARPYAGPGPTSGVPVYSRPGPREGRMRSAPGSVLYEMRAARDRGFPAVPGARPGPTEAGWRGVGHDLRDAVDDLYRRRYGDASLGEYRGARRMEETAIPVRDSAAAGAARDAGRPLVPMRNAIIASMAGAAGVPPGAAAGVGALGGGLDRAHGVAVRERLLDEVARGLESGPASAFAGRRPPLAPGVFAETGGGTRRTAGRLGAGEAVAAGRPDPGPTAEGRELFESLRQPPPEPEPDVVSSADIPVAPETTEPETAPAPAGRTRARRRPSAEGRRLFESLRSR